MNNEQFFRMREMAAQIKSLSIENEAMRSKLNLVNNVVARWLVVKYGVTSAQRMMTIGRDFIYRVANADGFPYEPELGQLLEHAAWSQVDWEAIPGLLAEEIEFQRKHQSEGQKE